MEKVLFDKLLFKMFIIEEFFEFERYKFIGIFIFVIFEMFVKWKKECLDKKVVEEVFRKVKEVIGCVLFESGNWWIMDDDDELEEDDVVWNLEKFC